MNDASLYAYLRRVKTLGRRALGAMRARIASSTSPPNRAARTWPYPGRARRGPPLAPMLEPEDDDDYEPTRVFEGSSDEQSGPLPSYARPARANSLLDRFLDWGIAGALAAVVAGATEAIGLQHAGLGVPARVGALRFVLISALVAVPAGAVIGAAICLGAAALGPSRLRAIRSRVKAPFIYAAGAGLPLMMAASFRLFVFLRNSFQNESLAALASAMLSAVVLAGVLATGLLVAAAARAAGRRYPVVLRRSTAVVAVVCAWTAIALPGFLAGPDDALRGPFGFIGLLRKDTLDYKPVVTAGAFFAALVVVFWVRRASRPVKGVLSAGLAVWAGIAAVRASDDAVRPVVLEHGTLTRASFRGLQKLGDWDHDGFSRWLGGGDCNDSDPRIHPGAREIPGNGVDEDCDGEDLPAPKPRDVGLIADAPRIPRERVPKNLSFLIITIDTLRPDLGYEGYPRDVSPHIDKLAAESVVYDHAYSISTYTGFCLPPLMASRYPSEMPRTNRHEVRYLPQNVLLAERLKAAGFKTAGAASHFLFSPSLGWIDGFDKFVHVPPEGDAPPGSHIDRYYTSPGLADAAISILKDPDVTQGRFFVWIHFLDPHHEYLKHPGFSKFGSAPRDLYDGEIAFTDFYVGRVLDALDASPLAQRTVVVLTGDHGEAFGEHGEYFHGREIWDEIVHVPLLVRVPGGVPRRIERRVSHVDVEPTVLDLAGLPPDPGARGHTLAPELFGANLPERPILVDQPRNPYYTPKRAFIEGGFKLHHLLDSNTYRLYDLDHDPHETHDLAPEQPAELARIRRDYAQYTSTIIAVDPVAPDAVPAR